MAKAAQTGKPPSSLPFLKLNGSKHCAHFSVTRCGNRVYLAACMKKEIILYMWASFPQNQFMKIKEYELTEKASRVELVIKNDRVSKIIAQCQSRFISINVETSSIDMLMESVVGKAVPVSVYPMGSEALLSFHSKT